MLLEDRTEDDYSKIIEAAVTKLAALGFQEFRTDLPHHPDPIPITRLDSAKSKFVPDIVAERTGKKAYLEIAKKPQDLERLVSKWYLLSKIAIMKDGFFGILTPKGTLKFTKEIVEAHNLEVQLIRI